METLQSGVAGALEFDGRTLALSNDHLAEMGSGLEVPSAPGFRESTPINDRVWCKGRRHVSTFPGANKAARAGQDWVDRPMPATLRSGRLTPP